MKKFLMLMISLLAFVLAGCGANTAQQNEETPPPTPTEETEKPASDQASKILVAYFSRAGDNYEVGVIEKGNTKIIAEMIAEKTGADLFEIKTVKEYPADYRECTEVAKQEQTENSRPELAALVDNLSQYDVVFVGYPIWWGDLPMAIYTFLEKQDFNGKTVIPFCTSAGDYMTGKESTIPELAKGSAVREGIGVKGKTCQDNPDAVREKVNAWLTGLGY